MWPGVETICQSVSPRRITSPSSQGQVDGVGGDGLVEVFGEAAAGVAAGDGVGVGGAGGDRSARGLQGGVAADVVGVPVRVDHQLDASGVGMGPVAGLVGVGDEAGVDECRCRAGKQEQVGVGEGRDCQFTQVGSKSLEVPGPAVASSCMLLSVGSKTGESP